MKSSFSFFWTAILLVSVLVSCTIEKRLYQRGYHVEWNKRARSANDEAKNTTEHQVLEQTVWLTETNKETIIAATSIEEETANEEETTTHASAVSIAQDHVTNTTQNATVNSNTNLDQQTETLDESHEAKSVLKKQSRHEHYLSGFVRGLLMILMGLLLILMGFLFQNILGGFGIILLIIFGLGGAIMIVAGIVIMILG